MPADSVSSAELASPVAQTQKDQQAPALFIAGWLNGFTGDDLKDDILSCYKPNSLITDTLYEAMNAYWANNLKIGDEKMSELEPLYEKALEGCSKEKLILIDVGGKVDEAKARPDWEEIKRKVFEDDEKEMSWWVDRELTKWHNGQFYLSGQMAGKIENAFVSAVPQEASQLESSMFFIPF